MFLPPGNIGLLSNILLKLFLIEHEKVSLILTEQNVVGVGYDLWKYSSSFHGKNLHKEAVESNTIL